MNACNPQPNGGHATCPALPIKVRRRHVRCPHCNARDEIIETDEALRWNRGEITVDNGRIESMLWSLGDIHFEHSGYLCECCLGPVTIPGDDTIPQDWS